MAVHRPPDGALIPRAFFRRDPVVCARELVGYRLRWGGCEGVIVETEAYCEHGDPACHTFSRPSARAFVSDHPEGTAYVYLNYGIHWMLNVLVGGSRRGFILIRAIEPTVGIESMRLRRGVARDEQLCSGPGKLARAFGVGGEHHGIDLCSGEGGRGFFGPREKCRIVADRRIGISRAEDFEWRFLCASSAHVSSRPKHRGPD